MQIIRALTHIARGLGIDKGMYRYRFGRRSEYGSPGGHRRRWPRSRAAGCLLWVGLLVVLLIVLSVLFGGFQKGTQVKGLGPVTGYAIVQG